MIIQMRRDVRACACCGARITPLSADPEHQYRLPVYELVIFEGRPAALRVGWRAAGLCKSCVKRIHAAADRRTAQKRAKSTPLDSSVGYEVIAPCAASQHARGVFTGKN